MTHLPSLLTTFSLQILQRSENKKLISIIFQLSHKIFWQSLFPLHCYLLLSFKAKICVLTEFSLCSYHFVQTSPTKFRAFHFFIFEFPFFFYPCWGFKRRLFTWEIVKWEMREFRNRQRTRLAKREREVVHRCRWGWRWGWLTLFKSLRPNVTIGRFDRKTGEIRDSDQKRKNCLFCFSFCRNY